MRLLYARTTIRNTEGERPVDAVRIVGVDGLVVTLISWPYQMTANGTGPRWTITHERTGLRIVAQEFRSGRLACEVAQALAGVTDWTQSEAELRDAVPFIAPRMAAILHTLYDEDADVRSTNYLDFLDDYAEREATT